MPPSPFESGLRGFGMGAAIGTAVGYLVARDDGFTERDWRPIVAGAGIGALAGGVLGLTVGIASNSSPASAGRGFLLVRDMAYGAEFGFFAGLIGGGLAALSTDKAEHILFGASIGTIAGAGVGLLVGGLERNPWAGPAIPPAASRPMASNALRVTFSSYRTASGSTSVIPSLSGHF